MSHPRILIVEDQAPVARAMAIALELDSLDVVTAAGPDAALDVLAGGRVDLVLQDMNFTPGATSGDEGVTLFRTIRSAHPDVPVLLVTAWASLETAVRLMKEGAADYLEKPWDDARLLEAVRDALSLGTAGTVVDGQVEEERRAFERRYDLGGLVYRSSAMHRVVALALRVARADVPVLVTGANGTGKERVAELIQANSSRRRQPFVKVHLGALPESLLEAELFGAEAGAFTGAERRRIGRFEAADGGTILLDEIGTLSASGQTRLLRVLQTGEFERLGSSETRRVDVRVIAATNADLRRAIAAGTFREDLFFRLNVIEIDVPPLADRRADVVPLAESFLRQAESAPDGTMRRLSAAARTALESYPWPGNVRELRNRIQRASLVTAGREILPADLDLGSEQLSARGGSAAGRSRSSERARIEEALLECGGIVARAAEMLGLSRQALYRRMQRLGIVLERRPRG